MSCKLQVFRHDSKERNSKRTYRFAVVDYKKSGHYPANFVCMLPVKLCAGKLNKGSAFGALYREKSLEFAVGLLNDALVAETEEDVKAEIEKRLRLIDPKQANLTKCSQCKKPFQRRKIRKYKYYLCDDCLSATRRNKMGII